MKRIFTFLLISVTSAVLYAQEFKYSVEAAGAVADGEYAPFWHISNRQGVISKDTESGYLRAALGGTHRFANNAWLLTYGADIIAGHNHTSTLFIQQAFADISWKRLTLSLGQKERWSNFKNHRLTTGGLTESGNARPIPQIRIEIPEYWDIFNTNGWFGLRAHIAYGWFTDEDWQKDFVAPEKARTVGTRYHSKAGYVKIGNEEKFPLTAEGGLEMTAQFGGTVYNMRDKVGENRHNPVGLKDYFKIFIPSSGDSDYSAMDQANIAGNHIGSWHAALTWHNRSFNIKAYYEHLFDDHSQMFWEYGLWTEQLVGVELSLKNFKWINNITLEYFNLKNQSGPIYHDSTSKIPDQISCKDDNYNHLWYGGWFNYGLVIGTPLVTSPIYNTNGSLITYNNRVEAFHIGLEGKPSEYFGYRLLLTKSNNWGTYDNPFTDIKNNSSGLAEFTFSHKKLEGWSATISMAFDNGDLYGDNFGGVLSIKKNGIFKLKE